MAISTQGAAVPARRSAEALAATLYLALFLVLLVVFIFLVSRTTFDPARSIAVIEGVEAQFAMSGTSAMPDAISMPVVPGAGREGLVADAGLAPGLAAVLDILETEVVGHRVDGPVHVAAISLDAVFIRETAAFSAAGRRAVDALGQILTDPSPDTVRRLDAAVVGAYPLSIMRAAALGAALAALAGPEAVSVRAQPETGAGNGRLQLVLHATSPDAGGEAVQ